MSFLVAFGLVFLFCVLIISGVYPDQRLEWKLSVYIAWVAFIMTLVTYFLVWIGVKF